MKKKCYSSQPIS